MQTKERDVVVNDNLTFPATLYTILDEVSINKNWVKNIASRDYSCADEYVAVNTIIGWRPHGRAFIATHPKLFEKILMGRYFRSKTYSSFQRQLLVYGFKRITRGPDKNSYYHDQFVRGEERLLRNIKRCKVKPPHVRMIRHGETLLEKSSSYFDDCFKKRNSSVVNDYVTVGPQKKGEFLPLPLNNRQSSDCCIGVCSMISGKYEKITASAPFPGSPQGMLHSHPNHDHNSKQITNYRIEKISIEPA